MEAGRNLLASSPPIPPRTHLKNSPSSSVLVLHEQSARALPFLPTIAQQFPTSVLLQEQRDESRPSLHIMKEDKKTQITLERGRLDGGFSRHEENNNSDYDQCLKDFQHRIPNFPGLWYLYDQSDFFRMLFLQKGDMTSLTKLSVLSKTKNHMDVEPHNVVALAKKALSASKQAALLTEDSQLLGDEVDESPSPSSRSTSYADFLLEETKTIRSTRLLERRSKKRKVPKPKVMVQETSNPGRAGLQRKLSKAYDPNDPLRLFLRGTETKQLLTVKEESELVAEIQNLMRLGEVKSRLQSQLDREPTMVEWAAAVGLRCEDLKFQLHRGNRSREKLIYANFRMVVHIAKKYQGRGLNLQDLLQEGSTGLMRSVEKFKPQAGCRFASYAYWWIMQAIKRAIFHHSRTIRLPDNVYSLLYKVTEAKRLCIQEGNHLPTKKDIAARVGITVEKLERLLFSARMPISIQQPVWTDQDATFQEITADPEVESPDASVTRQLMRQHVRNLLGILAPRERKILRLRYGIEGGKPMSLSDIGSIFGLCKERVRQLESRALNNLKRSLDSQGLGAYADLIV